MTQKNPAILEPLYRSCCNNLKTVLLAHSAEKLGCLLQQSHQTALSEVAT